MFIKRDTINNHTIQLYKGGEWYFILLNEFRVSEHKDSHSIREMYNRLALSLLTRD